MEKRISDKFFGYNYKKEHIPMTIKKLKQIENYVHKTLLLNTDPQHGYDHLERVRLGALKIAKNLRIRGIDLNLLQAACLLHDLPMSKFNHNPAIRHLFEYYAVKKYLPGILNELGIAGEDRKILKNAIQKHTFTIPYRVLNRDGDVYLKIMQDSDSLDFFSKEREESFNKNINRYLTYKVLSVISGAFLRYGRRNLKNYLNFPELAKYNWFKE